MARAEPIGLSNGSVDHNINDTTPKSVPDRLGLLSRRVFHSPAIKFIIPARIRSTIRHDVVFVGTHFVQVREIQSERSGCRTTHVAIKDDFASPIQNARVISLEGPQDPPCESPTIKREDDDNLITTSSGKPPRILGPPQMILLTLASLEIVLLGMRQSEGGVWVFETSKIQLPAPSDPLANPGDHLAVDYRSRAFAVAGLRDSLLVYRTRPTDSNDTTIQSLVQQSKSLSIDRTVVQMEFIQPEEEARDTIQLLLVTVTKNPVTCDFLFFSWDSNATLDYALSSPKVFSIARDFWFPHLLIPCVKFKGHFLLASESVLCLYSVTEGGHFSPVSAEARNTTLLDPPPHDRGSSLRKPLWVSWALPWSWKPGSEFVYLAREDGWVCYRTLQRQGNGSVNISAGGKGDCLANDLGSAFAIVDEATSYDQFRSYNSIFLVGDFCDGGLFQVGDGDPSNQDGSASNRENVMTPNKKETYYNWAPFRDAIAICAQRFSDPGMTNLSRDALVTTTGRNKSGSVSELRYGCESPIRATVPLDEALPGAKEVFYLMLSSSKENVIMLSAPYKTVILYATLGNAVLEDIELAELCNEPTLAVAVIPETSKQHVPTNDLTQDMAIHVTPSLIRLLTLCPPEEHQADLSSCPLENVLLAGIDTFRPIIVCVTRREEGTVLILKSYHISPQGLNLVDIGLPISLFSEPTCIAFIEAQTSPEPQSSTIIALGDDSGSVHFFLASQDDGLKPLLSHRLCREMSPVESVAWLASPDASSKGLLVCGFRSGILGVYETQVSPPKDIIITKSNKYRICNSPVKVVIDSHSPLSAFVFGGIEACHVKFTEPDAQNGRITNIYWTDRKDRSWSNGPVFSAVRPPLNSNLSGDIICLTSTDLLCGPFEDHAQPLPRQFPLHATPTHVLYSKALHAVVVASSGRDADASKRYILPRVDVFSLSDSMSTTSHFNMDDDNLKRASYDLGVGEEICSLIEWNVPVEEKHRHLIVLGTRTLSLSGESNGHVRVLRLSSDGKELKLQHSVEEKFQPVWAVCAYDDRSLIYCRGHDLIVRRRAEDGKFRKQAVFELLSPGVYITSEDNKVHVMTRAHSLQTFIFDGGELKQFSSDSQGRLGSTHLSVPELGLVLVCDRDQTIAGVRQPRQRTLQNSGHVLFEGTLPAHVLRLVRANIRPPWKRAQKIGLQDGDLLGISADGSLFSFDLLDEAAWRLLRFVQNLCSRNPMFVDGQRRFLDDEKHIEPDSRDKNDWHVDGDILHRLVGRPRGEAAIMLNQMLDATPQDDDDFLADFDNAEARRHRFTQVAHAALSSEGSMGLTELRIGGQQDDVVVAALKYIRAAIDIPF